VLKTLLDKLERIRGELGSDKVFDVVGRLFEGVSLREYMERALTEDGADAIRRRLEGTLTKEQVAALAEQEKRLYGDGGDVLGRLDAETAQIERERWRRLLPGYVRRFVSRSAPLLGLDVEGDLDGLFRLDAVRARALDFLEPVLATYPPHRRRCLTVVKPADAEGCVFLHPGEPLFDRLRGYVCSRFADAALRGGVFIDPHARRPYLFHLALVSVVRQADAQLPAFARLEMLAYQLVGLKEEEGGPVEPCAVEKLLLLKGGDGLPLDARSLAAQAAASRERARGFARERSAGALAERRRRELLDTLPDRLEFVSRGYGYQDAELATVRARLTEKALAGDSKAAGDLTRVKNRQRTLEARKQVALALLRRELELIAPGEVTFLAHALAVPSADPEDRKRHDADVEAIAVKVASAHEEAAGSRVQDVSTPPLAVRAGLTEHPGFDLLADRPAEGRRAIEVKGRAGIGEVELTENEWVQACNHRDRYWLYVVFDCASPNPRLVRVQDPFGKLIVKAKGSVVISSRELLAAQEETHG
jgi:hypothetical protein